MAGSAEALIPDWGKIVTRLVGAPFVWGARGPDAFDCWGIVAEGRKLAGLDGPDDAWPATGPGGAIAIMESEAQRIRWKKVDAPEPGDVVAMSTHKLIHHVGLATPFGVLHTSARSGAIVSSITQLKTLAYQRIEFYRWAP